MAKFISYLAIAQHETFSIGFLQCLSFIIRSPGFRTWERDILRKDFLDCVDKIIGAALGHFFDPAHWRNQVAGRVTGDPDQPFSRNSGGGGLSQVKVVRWWGNLPVSVLTESGQPLGRVVLEEDQLSGSSNFFGSRKGNLIHASCALCSYERKPCCDLRSIEIVVFT